MRLSEGQQAPDFSVRGVNNEVIKLSAYRDKKLLLCFFRYAGCPFCTTSTVLLLKDYSNLASAGLSVIAFYQSPKNTVMKYIVKKYHPLFPVVADPKKRIFRLYGIESSFLGWPKSISSIPHVVTHMVTDHVVQGNIDGDPNLIPAYFLIGPPESAIYQAHYSENFMNEVSIEDIRDFLSSDVEASL